MDRCKGRVDLAGVASGRVSRGDSTPLARSSGRTGGPLAHPTRPSPFGEAPSAGVDSPPRVGPRRGRVDRSPLPCAPPLPLRALPRWPPPFRLMRAGAMEIAATEFRVAREQARGRGRLECRSVCVALAGCRSGSSLYIYRVCTFYDLHTYFLFAAAVRGGISWTTHYYCTRRVGGYGI